MEWVPPAEASTSTGGFACLQATRIADVRFGGGGPQASRLFAHAALAAPLAAFRADLAMESRWSPAQLGVLRRNLAMTTTSYPALP